MTIELSIGREIFVKRCPMSSRHLGQYKGNFYITDEVLIANLSPTNAPVTRMRFQIVPFSYPCVFK